MLQTSVEMVKPGGTGTPARAHLGQAGAFAAENIFHLAVAIGCAAAEAINVVFHDFLFWSPAGNDLREIGDRRKFGQQIVQ